MFRKYYPLLLFFLFTNVASIAQTTPIGLSDPLININFGSGSSVFGPVYDPGYINFNYTASVPNFGFYTRVNNTSVNPNWWPTTDHSTGDGTNGYMLIAKPRQGVVNQVIFIDPNVNNLCSGTQYRASAFFLNVSNTAGGVLPAVKLIVEEAATGTPIAQLNAETLPRLTQNPTEADWTERSVTFTLPPGVSAVRVLVLCETAGAANLDDFAVDDITVNAVGQKIDVAFADTPLQNERTVCAAATESITLTATTPEAGNVLQWQVKQDDGPWKPIDNETSSNYTFNTPETPGRWSYRAASGPPGRVSSNRCNVVSNEIAIVVTPGVSVSAGPDKFYLIGGPPVILQGSSNSNDVTWVAESGDDESSLTSTNTAVTLASPTQNTTYRLIARSDGSNTCGPDVSDPVTVLVAVKPEIPNTFTPNGDGVNDRWIIGGIESYPNPVIQVYSRNGQLVYRSVGGAAPWDGTYNGKQVPAGNYYYIVDLVLNGMKLTGAVAVLR